MAINHGSIRGMICMGYYYEKQMDYYNMIKYHAMVIELKVKNRFTSKNNMLMAINQFHFRLRNYIENRSIISYLVLIIHQIQKNKNKILELETKMNDEILIIS